MALLKGLLFDDRGNAMSPSFSTKRGVRYRFYVVVRDHLRPARSSRVTKPRISAPDLETVSCRLCANALHKSQTA